MFAHVWLRALALYGVQEEAAVSAGDLLERIVENGKARTLLRHWILEVLDGVGGCRKESAWLFE